MSYPNMMGRVDESIGYPTGRDDEDIDAFRHGGGGHGGGGYGGGGHFGGGYGGGHFGHGGLGHGFSVIMGSVTTDMVTMEDMATTEDILTILIPLSLFFIRTLIPYPAPY